MDTEQVNKDINNLSDDFLARVAQLDGEVMAEMVHHTTRMGLIARAFPHMLRMLDENPEQGVEMFKSTLQSLTTEVLSLHARRLDFADDNDDAHRRVITLAEQLMNNLYTQVPPENRP